MGGLLRLLGGLFDQFDRKDSLKIAAGWTGILLLVPALVSVSLYPSSWWLGVISFQVGSMKVADFHSLTLFLVAATALLFGISGWRQQGTRRSRLPNVWLIGALLIAGLMLLLFGDRMAAPGSGTIAATSPKWDGYPGSYVSKQATERLNALRQPASFDDWLGLMGRLHNRLYPKPLPTDRAKSFIELADLAVELYKAEPPIGTAVVSKITIRHAFTAREIDANWPILPSCVQPHWTELSHWIGPKSDCDKVNRQRHRVAQQRHNELNPEASFLRDLRAAKTPEKKFELAATATAAVKVELDTLERQKNERIAFVWSVPYLVAASIAFILAMWVVGFRSWAMAFLTVATILATYKSVSPVGWREWADWFIVLYPAFVGIVAGFLWRFLFRSCKDNAEIWRALRLSKLLRAGLIVRVLIVASPFYLLIYAAHYINQYVDDELAAAIYCESSVFDCSAAKMLVYDSDPTRDTLRDDINAGVQRLFLEFEARALNAAASAPTQADKALHLVENRILAAFDQVLPKNLYEKFPDLEPPGSCWGFLLQVSRFVKCYARKIALEQLNAAYQAPRNQLRSTLVQALRDAAAKTKEALDAASAELKGAIQGEANKAARYVTRSVDSFFIAFSTVAVAQMAFALLVTMRALLLLAGRTLYGESRPRAAHANPKRKPPLDLLSWLVPLRWPALDKRLQPLVFPLTQAEAQSRSSENRATVDIHDEELELSGDDSLPLLVKRKYDVDDAYKVTALVRSRYHQWALRRLMNGCLILRWAWREEGKSAIRFSGPAGSRFVVWRIPEGAEVYFRWNEFVAFSASAKLKKTYSLRLGSLVTGTAMLPSIVGPGILIQVNRGITEVAKSEKVPPSVYPHRLISWAAGTEFRIRSPRGVMSLYFDPPSLEPTEGAEAVVDTDGGSSRGVGLLKELIRLIRP